MANNFRDIVSTYIQPLLDEYGFSPFNSKDWAPELRNSIVEYASSKYKIQLANEGGFVVANIGLADPNAPFYNLTAVISYITKFFYRSDFTGTVEEQVKRIVNQLTHYAELIFSDALLIQQAEELKSFERKWR